LTPRPGPLNFGSQGKPKKSITWRKLKVIALDRDLVKRLLNGINLKSAWGRRDYLLILFLYHTGLRIGECCRLIVHHVAHQGEPREELYLPACLTKTRKGRVIPLNDVAQQCVAKLLAFNKERGFSTAPAAPLFPWKDHGFLSPREAQRMMQQLREKVGVSPKATPHTLRHTFASELVRNGASLPTVSSLLGHVRLSSTQIYTHTTNQEKRDAVGSLARRPRANP
jgi:site-specific recombinase XerD